MKPIIVLTAFLLLSSCESKRAANKTEWLKKRGYLQLDTLRFTDTIKGFTHDTIIQFDSVTLTDTLIVEKNGIKTVTVVKWKDRIVQQTITQHDTIKHYLKPIIKEKCPECKQPFNWWLVAFFGLLIISVITLIKK